MVNKIFAAHKTLGVVFIALLLLGVWFTYAVFTKQFADYEEVTLKTSNVGLQLPNRADVKVRGVIVGEVLAAEPNADGVDVTLGIYPDKVDDVPADVTGLIVPKTLFGEKYVSLVVPDGSSYRPIKAEAVIERTEVATEVEEVLADLHPLLTAVKPEELNLTLTAIATALEGRGSQLGENLETVDAYLKRINPQIPALVEDLRLTAEVSDIYADILPEIGQILDDTIVTIGTLEEKEASFRDLLVDIRSFAGTARAFLAANADRLERFGEISTAQLEVLSRYSTEFPCLAKGILNAEKLEAEAFRGFELHIILETLPNQPRPYDAGDRPHFGDNRGPACVHLPNPPSPVTHQPNFNDGVDRPTGKGTSRVAPQYDGLTADPLAYQGLGYRGAPADVDLLRDYLDGVIDGGSDDALGLLLSGPLVVGGER